MKHYLVNPKTAALLTGGLFLAGTLTTFALGLNVSVSSSVGTSGGIQVQAKVSALVVDRANREIDRRISAINAIIARIDSMSRISATEKTTLTTSLQAQITELNALKIKIAADANSSSTLKEDVQSITKSYRIFALIIPQASIQAAADRVLTIADNMTVLSAKLKTRIDAAKASSTDTTAAETALADMNIKIIDAKAQAGAAVSAVASLTPDMGDQTKLKANLAALQSARAKIQAAMKDFSVARQDAATILRVIHGLKVGAEASTSVSASSSSN